MWILALVFLIVRLRESSRAYVSRFRLVDDRDDRDHPRGAAARDLRGSAANANSAREHLKLNRASAVTLVESATYRPLRNCNFERKCLTLT